MSIEWPEEVAKKIGLAIEGRITRGGHAFPSTKDLGLAALDALGGERVYVDDRSRTQIWLHRRHERPSRQSKKVEPAILIKLEGE